METDSSPTQRPLIGESLKVYDDCNWFVGLVIALRPQTPKHIRGSWSHYIDTSEPVDDSCVTMTSKTIGIYGILI
jgi:hypothetical protein